MTFRSVAPLCPGCGALLEGTNLFEARVERCTACGGAWLDALDPPLEGAPQSARDLRLRERSGACPRCERELAPARLGAGNAFSCASCAGVFVPRGSFADVLGEAKSGTMPPPRPNHVRVLAVLRALARLEA